MNPHTWASLFEESLLFTNWSLVDIHVLIQNEDIINICLYINALNISAGDEGHSVEQWCCKGQNTTSGFISLFLASARFNSSWE